MSEAPDFQTTTEVPVEQPAEAPVEAQSEGTEADTQSERSTLLRQAYGAATARLREGHREEFDQFYAEEAQKRGVDYTPRLTPEQKAEQEFLRLLEQHPHLREKAAGQTAE